MTGWFLFAALLLLIANAFFVAVEFALLASRVTRLEPMAEDDDDDRAAVALASIRDLQPRWPVPSSASRWRHSGWVSLLSQRSHICLRT